MSPMKAEFPRRECGSGFQPTRRFPDLPRLILHPQVTTQAVPPASHWNLLLLSGPSIWNWEWGAHVKSLRKDAACAQGWQTSVTPHQDGFPGDTNS